MIDLNDWQRSTGLSNEGASRFFDISVVSFNRMKSGKSPTPQGVEDQALDLYDAIVDIRARYGLIK